MRIELGPKDIEAAQCVMVRRDTREKVICPIAEAPAQAEVLLQQMQQDMYDRALAHLESHIVDTPDAERFAAYFEETKGFARAMWCGDRACEDKIKEDYGVTSRCIPYGQKRLSEACVCCGREAKHMVLWGRSY